MKIDIDKENRKKSGVYKIVNQNNGKIYIGSACVLISRFNSHFSLLKNNKHDNAHLQNSYNKHGADSFLFSIVELASVEDLLLREQHYLDFYFDNGVQCFNMNCSVAPITLNNKYRKDFKLIDPNGQLIEFKSCFITDIARQINVNVAGLYAILNKKCLSHHGWRLEENKDYDYKNWRETDKNYFSKFYDVKLLSPDGEIFGPIKNIHEFCRRNQIENVSHIFNLIAGRTRYVNGWSIYNGTLQKPIEKNAKVFDVKLVAPDGVIYGPISNLTKFAKEHKLNISSLRNLLSGKIKSKFYQGWMLKV